MELDNCLGFVMVEYRHSSQIYESKLLSTNNLEFDYFLELILTRRGAGSKIVGSSV